MIIDPPLQISMIMKNYIIQNARGANNPEFRRHCRVMIQIHRPSLLALLETKISDHKALTNELGSRGQI